MEELVAVRPADCDFELLVPARLRKGLASGKYERYSSIFFKAATRHSDAVVDIGAQVGYYSILAKRTKPRAKVIAIESSPDKMSILRRNLELNSVAVDARNAVFGEIATETPPVPMTEGARHSRPSDHPPYRSVEVQSIESVGVPRLTAEDLGIEPGTGLAIKIDVNGHELEALRGLEKTISDASSVRMLVAFNPNSLRTAGTDPSEILDWLDAKGLRVFALYDALLFWRELGRNAPWDTALSQVERTNLFCMPHSDALSVSFVLHSGNLGGTERFQVELAEDLIESGAMVNVVLPASRHRLKSRLKHVGCSVDEVRPYPWWVGESSPTGTASSELQWAHDLVHFPLIDALKDADSDVVVTQTSVFPEGAIAAAILEKPHVWYLHEFIEDYGFGLPYPKEAFADLIVSLSTAVVANSRATRDYFFPDSPEDISVIYPIATMAPVKVPRKVRPFTLGVVGRLQPVKSQSDAILAVSMLRQSGLDVPLVLVGGGESNERIRLQRLAKRSRVDDLITFAGVIEDKIELFSRFDAIAVTSRREGFGRVPFEASAAGRPVIYSDAGGVSEYMIDGVTGLAYSPGNVSELAAAIQMLASNPILRSQLSRAARSHLRSVLKSNGGIESFQRLLREVIAPSTDSSARRLVHLLGPRMAEARANSILLEHTQRMLEEARRELHEATRELEIATIAARHTDNA